MDGERLRGDLDALREFAEELSRDELRPKRAQLSGPGMPDRINADSNSVEEGLTKLVLSLVDLLRQLLEKQAVRRIEAGSLSDDQIERMGETFLRLEAKMAELRVAFGLDEEDLTLSLGPLRDLVAE
jgi:Gas vesicle protein K